MKNLYLIAVLTVSGLLGTSVNARAQDTEGISVNVPFEFVVSGKTLPAGTYTIGRLSDDAFSGIAVSTRNQGALVLPIAIDGPRSAGQAKLSFEFVGNTHFLRQAETPAGTYTFALPKAMVALAQAKDQDTVSMSGTK